MSTMTSDGAGSGTEDRQQALLNFAVSHSPVIFYVADAQDEYKVHFVSENVLAATGHVPEAFVSDSMFGRRHLHPDDLASFNEALVAVKESGRASREYRMRTADGRYMWFRDEMRLTDGGRQFVGSMVDVTAEKQAQDRLRAAEELNAAIIGTVRGAIIAADRDGKVIDFNASAERIFGYPRDQALGRPLADLIVPEAHRAAHIADIERLNQTGEMNLVGRRLETTARRRDGSEFAAELNITCTRLNGETVFVGEISDISDRVAAEAERRRLGQLMQDAIEKLPNGFAVSDTDGRIVMCNAAFAALYGRGAGDMVATSRRENIRTISGQLRRFDDMEVTGTDEDIDRIMARMDDPGKGPVEMELEDGRWMLVSQGSTSDGGLVVVRTDITHQKQIEQALRESEEHFRQIVENHPLPVLLFDVKSGNVLYESPAVTALFRRGFSIANDYSSVDYFPDHEERKRFTRALRRDGEVRDFEARARLHDGGTGWLSVSARMISYRGRDTVIASLVDLTERKAQEEALAASEARYRTLFENAPVCIHEISLDGHITSMNPRGLQIAGAPKVGPVIGGRYLDLIHPDDRATAAEKFETAVAGQRVEMEFRGFTGKGHYYSTKIPLRNDQGEVEKLIGVVIEITDRKRQEIEIQTAREMLEDAIESLPDGFALWDADARLITCNTRFREYNRISADELKPGVAWRDFMRVAVKRGQYSGVPEDVDGWIEQLWRELNEEGRTREFRGADGRWFRATARPTRQGGLVGIRSDITRYKNLEDALRDSEALVRQVLEAAPVPIIMTTVGGRILYESPAGRALFGRSVIQDTDTAVQAWVDPQERERYIGILREKGAVDEYEATLCSRTGNVFPGAISARLINYKGEEVIVSSTRDLTESRAMAAQMQRQREALYQSEKLSAMGQLLASVAHELNNPLSVVVGQSLLLEETAGEPRVVERAVKIGKAAERCARIVKTFLAMARQQPTEMASVSLNTVVETALDVTGSALRSSSVDVDLKLAPDLPPAWADADQLNQVLTNLIVNAQQALEGRQTDSRRITITTGYEPDARQLVLVLSDNGPGMPPEISSRIFEPFFTTKDKGGGTGIGLAVSHRILATHGGTISCDTEPGRGAVFTIRLPAAPEESRSPADGGVHDHSPRALMVLVVDDEPDVADVIAELLRSDGHRVVVAESGQAALDRLKTERFDLILSDIRMPELDGPAFYGRLAEIRPDMAGRVAFVTGDMLSPKARDFLESIDCPRLEKPVTLAELRDVVGRFVAGD